MLECRNVTDKNLSSMIQIKSRKCLALLILICSFCLPSKGQDVYSWLRTCGKLLSERRTDYYDTIEHYLLDEADKDSIRNDSLLDILYHEDLALLYTAKYNDNDRAIREMEYVKDGLHALKKDKESREPYKVVLGGLATFYFNAGRYDEAQQECEEYITLSLTDEINPDIVNKYSILSKIYEAKGDSLLAENAHKNCQLGIVRLYVKEHPQQSALLQQFQTLLKDKESCEMNYLTGSIDYVHTLILIGQTLMKTCGDDVVEPFRMFLKAYQLIHAHNLARYKTSLLEVCYIALQELYIKYAPEPTKSLFIKQLVPELISHFEGILDESRIYESVASSYGANGYYQQALDYDKLALAKINMSSDDASDRKLHLYDSIIEDCLGLKSDTANAAALGYIRELKSLSINRADSIYDKCLINEGCVLRYLYKIDESLSHFKACLPYFKKKYSETSNRYIECLNQLAMTSEDNAQSERYLMKAKRLIGEAKDVNSSNVYGVSINLAKCYIKDLKWNLAAEEIKIAKQIEIEIFGNARLSTLQLEEQCLLNIKQ